jgi:hypothetical protein
MVARDDNTEHNMRSSLEGTIVNESQAAAIIGVSHVTIARWRSRGWVSVGRIGRDPGPLFDLGPPPLIKVGGSHVGLRSEIEAWAEEWRKAAPGGRSTGREWGR